jgi:predicted DNA-binding transcriptional regulator AlpA
MRPTDPDVARAERGAFSKRKTKAELLLNSATDGNPHQTRGPPLKLGLSIKEFCDAVGISVSYFYELKSAGLAPRMMKFGVRWIISVDEARRWCAERTKASNPQANMQEEPAA